MPVTLVVGAQWGDEGKGRIIDFLAAGADAVARFGGGANAGHTVRVGEDGWAIYSQDNSLAAHFEFTIAVTEAGPRILTPWHESRAQAAA